MTPSPHDSPIGVLIVDDSATARAVLKSLVSADPSLRVIGTAPDAFSAARSMRDALPDVMLLDLELPQMDGLTFLRKIMTQRPIPVVICSSHTGAGSDVTLRALELGAADVIGKPSVAGPTERQEAQVRVCDAIHAAFQTRRGRKKSPHPFQPGPKLSADEILPPPRPGLRRPARRLSPMVAIGASTGGTEALSSVLRALPRDAPPVAVVQHMPKGFTAAFARRLDGLCPVTVQEARDGDALEQGRVLIAPGDRHMLVRRTGGGYRVELADGPYVSRHRPSVDVLFRSVAQAAGPDALGIIMTGMGDDGARCMAEMRDAGARTIAQDEQSCVVYGMPREAVRHGGVTLSLPLDRLWREIAAWNIERSTAAR